MAKHGSTSAVIKAIMGNAAVTLAKAIAWIFSGSGAMLAETVHSAVDTANQCLLLIGQKRSALKPTRRHPYGYGLEESFWGVLAAVGILVFGGGLTIEHGIANLAHPHVPDKLPLVFVVLAIGIIVEGYVLYTIFKPMAKTRGDRTWIQHVKNQAPGTVFVIVEDIAAVLGCFIAAFALVLCIVFENGIFDVLAQLTIGFMLAGVGMFLLWRNRGALIGQSLPTETVVRIREFLEDLEGIDRITDLKTRQLSATTFRIKAEVVFSGGWLAQRLMDKYGKKALAADEPAKANEILGRFAHELFEEQARHVDWLEEEITEAFPGATHIDLEPHLKDC